MVQDRKAYHQRKENRGEIEQRTQEKEGEEVKEQVEYVHKNPERPGKDSEPLRDVKL